MDTDKNREESTATDIPGLIAQARAAYQQNRIKECLALTKAALLVDPGNAAAIEIQSSVRFDMQRDLSDARALIEESRNKPEAQKYRKAAEIILLKALYLDPDSEGAKTLLSSIRSVAETPMPAPSPVPAAHLAQEVPTAPLPPAPPPAPHAVSAPAPAAAAKPAPTPAPVASTSAPFALSPASPVVQSATAVLDEPPVMPEVHAERYTERQPERMDPHTTSYVTQPGLREPEPIPFTTGTTFSEKTDKKKNKRSGLMVPIVIVAILVLGGGLMLTRQKLGGVSSAAASPPTTTSDSGQGREPAKAAYPVNSTSAAANATAVAADPKAKQPLIAVNAPPPLPASKSGETAPPNSRTTPATAGAVGSLSISSPIAAEIYMGDKYLGSTPTTLQLPAGNQTLEYRHGDLRSVVTHTVKANETSTALVSFDIVVAVNATPWANVFVEGSARLPLGQTPLSGVQLPVGSVLVFENPNFPSKSHKVVINDKTIQVAFP